MSKRPLSVDLDAELGEGVNVRVEPAAPDHVAARRRDARAAEAGEQRPGKQERGADLAAELGVELGLRAFRGVDPDLVRARPFRCRRRASASSATIVSTSRIRGTFDSVTGSLASSVAARIGSAPFLFPAAETRPARGGPPSMTKHSIRASATRVADMSGLSY